MATSTGAAGVPSVDHGGRCDFHDGPSPTTQRVVIADRVSGPPATASVCAPCREQRGLEPAPAPAYPVPSVGMLTCLTPAVRLYGATPTAVEETGR